MAKGCIAVRFNSLDFIRHGAAFGFGPNPAGLLEFAHHVDEDALIVKCHIGQII